MSNIQLKAVARFEDGEFGPYMDEVPAPDADYFALYLGQAGEYECIADFYDLDLAKTAGQLLAAHLGHAFIDAVIY